MAGRSRRVVWAEGARNGLHSALEYISEDSPDAAGYFLGVVLDTGQSLSFLSERGRIVPEFSGRIYEKYLCTVINCYTK